jgi:hypothetical protein
MVEVANPNAGFPADGVKRRDGDASLSDFTDKTVIEPVQRRALYAAVMPLSFGQSLLYASYIFGE